MLIDGCEDLNCSGGCPLTTNNEMELYAIYASMKDFLLRCESGDVIEVCSDSSYCIDIFTKWVRNWQKMGWRKSDGKPIKNQKLVKTIWKLMADIDDNGCTLRFLKVKGHSSDKMNNKADELAVEAKMYEFKSGKTTYFDKNDGLLGGKSKFAD